ncbi:MAG: acetoacetate decarboxylase family protein [Defluviitaleaceae bacterium]|nr:acetoacetate decarboxylase family protein [Defluviitaleaceae bacterium]
MKSSYFVPEEKMRNMLKEGAMNSMDGICLFGVTDPGVKRLLPPPLELTDPANPLFYLYIVNIREPSFAPWYLEGGIGVMAKYGDKTGVYFFNLMLSGPGALMGAFTGREGSGLPKKLCERILVERTGNYGRCYMERNGVRLVDVELEIGSYNDPGFSNGAENSADVPGGLLSEGGCLLHKYRLDGGGAKDMELIFYDSPSRYYSWEPAAATVKLASSIDDPYGEIPLVSVLGAAWYVSDNWVRGMSTLYRYPQDKTGEAMRYLFTGRYDQCLLYRSHQIYETK